MSILFRVLQISKIISLLVIKAKCFWQIQTEAYRNSYWAEAYSEPGQTYKMKLYIKIVNDFPAWTIFAKGSILDVWLGSEYASVGICYSCLSYYFKIFHNLLLWYPISCHWSLSIPPENIRKLLVWFPDVFRGYRKRPAPWNELKNTAIVNRYGDNSFLL